MLAIWMPVKSVCKKHLLFLSKDKLTSKLLKKKSQIEELFSIA